MTYMTKKYKQDPVNHLPIFHRINVSGMNLVPYFSPYKIENVLVIQGPMSNRAVESAQRLGYNVRLIESFNYLDRTQLSPYEYDNVKIKDVFPTKYYESQEWAKQVRLRGRLDHNQVCRILNHMAAWSTCMTLSTPCIVLEHDAILLDKHELQVPRNSIHCLSDDKPVAHNSNWLCMGQPFAYSVDNHSSKRLFNKIMEEGIAEPLEVAIRLDQFMVVFNRMASRIRYADSSAVTLDSNASTLATNA